MGVADPTREDLVYVWMNGVHLLFQTSPLNQIEDPVSYVRFGTLEELVAQSHAGEVFPKDDHEVRVVFHALPHPSGAVLFEGRLKVKPVLPGELRWGHISQADLPRLLSEGSELLPRSLVINSQDDAPQSGAMPTYDETRIVAGSVAPFKQEVHLLHIDRDGNSPLARIPVYQGNARSAAAAPIDSWTVLVAWLEDVDLGGGGATDAGADAGAQVLSYRRVRGKVLACSKK